MRVGYLMQNGAPDLTTLSGPQLHVFAVIRGLQKMGHQVRTVAIQQGKIVWSDDLQNWFPATFKLTRSRAFQLFESGIRRIQFELRLPFLGVFDSFRYADACIQLLSGYDLLYERHGYLGYGGVIAARSLGTPLIIELNGNIVKEIDEMGVHMTSLQRNIGRWLTIRTLLEANHLVAVSEALKDLLISTLGFPKDQISVVLNGVDAETFTQSHNEKLVREHFSIGFGPTVTFVGSFQPWHGVDLLVSSFYLVQSAFPEAQLLLIGEGTGSESVEKQIAELGLQGNVNFLGRLPQKEVAAVLSLSDVAVAPYPLSHPEIVGTPLKLMEYMAAGRAIVASTAPIHEVITDGVTGLRVAPASVNALAHGIKRLLEDRALRAKLGANAAREARAHSWDHCAEALDHILMDCAPHRQAFSSRDRCDSNAQLVAEEGQRLQ